MISYPSTTITNFLPSWSLYQQAKDYFIGMEPKQANTKVKVRNTLQQVRATKVKVRNMLQQVLATKVKVRNTLQQVRATKDF